MIKYDAIRSVPWIFTVLYSRITLLLASSINVISIKSEFDERKNKLEPGDKIGSEPVNSTLISPAFVGSSKLFMNNVPSVLSVFIQNCIVTEEVKIAVSTSINNPQSLNKIALSLNIFNSPILPYPLKIEKSDNTTLFSNSPFTVWVPVLSSHEPEDETIVSSWYVLEPVIVTTFAVMIFLKLITLFMVLKSRLFAYISIVSEI